MPSLHETVESLVGCLASAKFETAWNLVKNLDPDGLPDGADMNAVNITDALKLRSMAAEVCDYLGDYAKAREFVGKAGEFCHRSLRSLELTVRLDEKGREKVLQQVWTAIQAGLALYRSVDYDGALNLFEAAGRGLMNSSVVADTPRWGTKARVQYSLGLVHREKYELYEAIQCFTASTELAYDKLKEPKGKFSNLAHIALARSIGMGLASVHNTLGRPDLAAPLLMAAKAILPEGEKLISTHLDLIRATLSRVSSQVGGADTDPLNRLKECHETFSSAEHALYRARAAYFLSKEYVQRARPDESKPLRQKDKEQLRLAEELLGDLDFSVSGDLRFQFYGLLLRSQIARKRGSLGHAEELAGLGLSQISGSRYPSIFVELSITRGLTRMQNGNPKGAIDDFAAGAQTAENAKNRRLQALFYLYLCQASSALNRDHDAARHLRRFEELSQFMEVKTEDVAILEAATREIAGKRGPDFILTLKDDLDPEEVQRRFRRFLVEWARNRSENDGEAAAKLDITRQTLYNWLQH